LLAPSPTLDGFGPTSGVCLSEAAALGERLRFSLTMMSESRAPIYLSKSKAVLKYYRKNKVSKLDKHLLEEALETFSVPKASSLPSFGVATKPLLEPSKDRIVSMPAQDEGCQPILRRGFLLPRGTAPSPSEVGVSSRAAFVDVSSGGEVVLKSLVVLPGQHLILASIFKLRGSHTRGMRMTF
jgi:hypothetical protein